MPDEPAWGQFRRLARENGIHSFSTIGGLAARGAIWPQTPELDWRRQMIRLMAGTTERSALLAYFQARCLYPQLLPSEYWLSRWPALLSRWGLHHATVYPSPLVIRSCSDCAREDVEAHGFSWFRQGHQLPGVEWCSRHASALHQQKTSRDLLDKDAYILVQPPIALLSSVELPPFVQRYLQMLDWLRAPANRGRWQAVNLALIRQLDGGEEHEDSEGTFRRIVTASAPSDWFRKNFIQPQAIQIQQSLKYPQRAGRAWLALCAAALELSTYDMEVISRNAALESASASAPHNLANVQQPERA